MGKLGNDDNASTLTRTILQQPFRLQRLNVDLQPSHMLILLGNQIMLSSLHSVDIHLSDFSSQDLPNWWNALEQMIHLSRLRLSTSDKIDVADHTRRSLQLPQLTELHLTSEHLAHHIPDVDARKLKRLLWNGATNDRVLEIASRSPLLERLDVSWTCDLEDLAQLQLSSQWYVVLEAGLWPCLKSLSLFGTTIVIRHQTLSALAKSFPVLDELDLDNLSVEEFDDESADADFFQTANRLPAVSSLRIVDCSDSHRFSIDPTRLQTLTMDNASEDTFDDTLPRLLQLRWYGSWMMTNFRLANLARSCPLLQSCMLYQADVLDWSLQQPWTSLQDLSICFEDTGSSSKTMDTRMQELIAAFRQLPHLRSLSLDQRDNSIHDVAIPLTAACLMSHPLPSIHKIRLLDDGKSATAKCSGGYFLDLCRSLPSLRSFSVSSRSFCDASEVRQHIANACPLLTCRFE